MMITLEHFRDQLAENRLRLALVGMSNSGKSTCTNVLSKELNFNSFEVDQAINSALNIGDMTQAAQWMGYPFEPRYAENKRRYLALESQYTRAVVPDDRNFVLDTTGSIIYGEKELLDWIRNNFLIVGLKVSEKLCNTLVEDYFIHPKTVIWDTEFSPMPGEDGIETLKRCYPTLLKNRAKMYSQLADVEIKADISRDPNLDSKGLIAAIEQAILDCQALCAKKTPS